MAYTRSRASWQDAPATTTPILAANLDHIEDGILDVDAAAADTAQDVAVLGGRVTALEGAGTGPRLPTNLQPFKPAQFIATGNSYYGTGSTRLLGYDNTDGLLIVADPSFIYVSADRGATLSAQKSVPVPGQSNPGSSIGAIVRFKGLWVAVVNNVAAGKTEIWSSPAPGFSSDCTWTKRQDQTTGTRALFPCLAANADVCLAAEYGDPKTSGTNTAKLWRSTDGTTWTAAWTGDSATRHVHAVAADPYSPQHWYATIGDGVAPCLLRSTDNGATWAGVPAVTADYMSVSISFTADNIWLAPDVTNAPLWLLDRATRTTLRAGGISDHRRMAVPIPGRHLLGRWTAGSPTINDYYDSPFTTDAVGLRVTGAGIPAGTTIASVTDVSTATMSANATVTGFQVPYRFTLPEQFNSDCFIGQVDPATGVYYFLSSSNSLGANEGLPNGRCGLFFIPRPGDPVQLLDVLPSCDYMPALLIAGGWLFAHSMRRPLLTF